MQRVIWLWKILNYRFNSVVDRMVAFLVYVYGMILAHYCTWFGHRCIERVNHRLPYLSVLLSQLPNDDVTQKEPYQLPSYLRLWSGWPMDDNVRSLNGIALHCLLDTNTTKKAKVNSKKCSFIFKEFQKRHNQCRILKLQLLNFQTTLYNIVDLRHRNYKRFN